MGHDAPRVDEVNECIWKGERRVELAPKAFLVLCCLMRQPHQIVTKRALLDAVWPDTHVTEGVLTLAVNQLREALGDDSRQPRFIETVHGRGYRWIGELSVTVESTAASPTSEPRLFVGREAALAQLEQALARAASGSRQIVFVTGEPGIGKTALIDEFVELVGPTLNRRATPRLVRGQCVDGFGTSDAYMPLLEALERLCRQSTSEEVVALLRRLAPAWLLQLPRLLKTGEQDELRLLLAGSSGERMVRELLSFVEELTIDRTLVLVLEDLHWSDHATVGALAALAARRNPACLLVIASYRPADAIAQQHPVTRLKHELTTKGQCMALALDGLTTDAVGAYLAGRFPHHRLPLALAPQLHAETAGNPLFMLNALEDFVERGWLDERGGKWECTVDLATLAAALPDGTRAMIGFRLQQLSAADLHLLETASVIGQSFATQALAAVIEREPAEIEIACTRLAQAAHFLGEGQTTTWPDGGVGMQHAFRHALYQQVLYERVTPARRQLLHRRVGECLEQGFAQKAKTIAPQLALHFERGGDLERTVRHRRRAAREALGRYAYNQAIEHLRSALAALARWPAGAARDSQELAIYAALLGAVWATLSASSAEVLHVVERIRFLSSRGQTTPELLQALAALVAHHAMRGDMRAARSASEQMLERSNDGPSGSLLTAVARELVGYCQVLQGDFEAGVENLERSIDLPDLTAVVALDPGTHAAANAAFGHCLLGRPSRGRDLARTAIRRAEASKHPPTIIMAALNGVWVGAMLLDDELLEENARRVVSLHEQLDPHWEAWSVIADGLLEVRRGRPGGAERIQRGRQSLLATGTRGFHGLCGGIAATGLLLAGRLDDAEVVLADCLSDVSDTGECWYEAELHRLRGEIRLARLAAERRATKRRRELGADAEACLRRALEVARGQGAKWWELRAAFSLARFLRDGDRAAEAREMLGSVYGEIKEGFDLPDMRAAQELMQAL